MEIIKVHDNSHIDIEFLDSHHYIKERALYHNFKNGHVKNPYDKSVFDIGYVGVGPYVTKRKGKPTQEYQIWKTMLQRCYSEKYRQMFNAYYGISSCCEEWLNFQTFAAWYLEHRYECDGRLHLDKDIKYPGNKIYSPQHCLLVPQRINTLFGNPPNNRGLPNGIRKAGDQYIATYNANDLGSASTLMDAYYLYAEAKKAAIVSVAEEYKNQIPIELYNALLEYEVHIENDQNYTVEIQ